MELCLLVSYLTYSLKMEVVCSSKMLADFYQTYVPEDSAFCTWSPLATFLLVSRVALAYLFTLKMEAVCSSKMSEDFYQTTLHYLPEDRLCLLHASCWFLSWLTFWPWRWRQYIPLKRWWTYTRVHGITSQKTVPLKIYFPCFLCGTPE
jgi:hypothetical protein